MKENKTIEIRDNEIIFENISVKINENKEEVIKKLKEYNINIRETRCLLFLSYFKFASFEFSPTLYFINDKLKQVILIPTFKEYEESHNGIMLNKYDAIMQTIPEVIRYCEENFERYNHFKEEDTKKYIFKKDNVQISCIFSKKDEECTVIIDEIDEENNC